MKKLAASLLLLLSLAAHAEDACTLRIGETARRLHDFGRKDLAEIAPTFIWFAPDEGNIVPRDPQGRSPRTFNYNMLYRVTGEKGAQWYFRFAGEWFDKKKTRRSAFYAVQWADGKWPVFPGKYRIESVYSPRPQDGKTFATIGDSMTWFGEGQQFRCDLAKQMPGYRFIGSNTDTYGYGHDGHGGDDTVDVLARLNRVPASGLFPADRVERWQPRA